MTPHAVPLRPVLISEIQGPHFRQERVPVDLETSGGVRLVPLAAVEHPQDEPALEIIAGLDQALVKDRVFLCRTCL